MQNQNEQINNVEQLDTENEQKQENSVLNSVNPDLVEVKDLIGLCCTNRRKVELF
ncbi:hypothetical protein [Acinetobacter baumannii]|uniref:hypothetical protein n=1 Tax=Acinetobacter baumannii TaxID=470 RepID=UPI001C04D357|nr:hypothetical protein [Acinetobacter baumannii]MBU0414412.1 hypothetical protein [Acinetobacter baumannii]UMN18670.1 hypothetical protein L2Z06_17655 [Acinetobacter baumannii]